MKRYLIVCLASAALLSQAGPAAAQPYYYAPRGYAPYPTYYGGVVPYYPAVIYPPPVARTYYPAPVMSAPPPIVSPSYYSPMSVGGYYRGPGWGMYWGR
jgi:hypothetical protein